jgi:hypothetical protein
MPTKKRTGGKKSGSNKKGGGDSNKETSTINNFTSSRSPSPVNVSGSTARSSESLKPVAETSTTKTNTPFFSATNKARLLSVPASAASAATAVVSAVTPSSIGKSSSGGLVIRYLIVIIILAFLVLTLYLYLEKPKTTSITHLYDPVYDFFNKLDRKADKSGINKLAKTIDEKKVVNNIDNKGTSGAGTSGAGTSGAGTSGAGSQQQATGIGISEKKYKKKPVIPEADDATSQTQRKPKSKSGYCFIGEDKGFRSCIEVGEGDICMSGDIFPTRAICINPNLRE